MWRGPALADFTYDPFAQAEIARLEELRLDAVEERVEADLALGKAADLIGELEALIRDNPLRERLRGQLMLALYRSGRQADALEAYRQTCKVLDEQLGLAPSPPLERLQTAILRQEPALEISIEAVAVERPMPASTDGAPAPSEVRKTVTVLIARRRRIRGLDPEALSSEDERYSVDVAQTVARYGGTVTSSVGSAVIAVFGVPRAHEDDAFRAMSAALEIRDSQTRDAIGSDSATGVGVVTGEVLARGSGTGTVSVVGEPITAAAELEEAAAAGEILLDAETERLVRGRASVEQVEAEAGFAWRLRDLARERPAVGSLKAPLVGRERRGRPAPAGVRAGDSRARAADAHDPRHRGDREIEARSGTRLARRRTGDRPRRQVRALRRGHHLLAAARDRQPTHGQPARTRALVPGGHEARPLADSLEEAIGDAGGSSDREEIFWATRSLFEALARERPLVVFFEDVHWAEPTFLDLVEYLAERVRGAPILVVCIARPELLDERPGWVDEKPNSSSLHARAPSGPRRRGADRQPRPRPRPSDTATGPRDRRWKPPVHRAARRHARRKGW